MQEKTIDFEPMERNINNSKLVIIFIDIMIVYMQLVIPICHHSSDTPICSYKGICFVEVCNLKKYIIS
jgi:hypothetical protein